MTEDVQARAEARLLAQLEETGARDPREFYRSRLKELREVDRSAYDQAVVYYRDVLLPAVADGDSALAAWTEYGRTLAELRGPGRTVSIDTSGRALPYEAPADPEHLVLHLPEVAREPALLVGLPTQLTAAQRATYDWLVGGRNKVAATVEEG